MPFSREAITKIAKLARLQSESTQSGHSIQEDLTRIVNMVDQITRANTSGITPMAHPLEMNQPLRKDVVSAENQRDQLLKLAPEVEAGLILVPTVIE